MVVPVRPFIEWFGVVNHNAECECAVLADAIPYLGNPYPFMSYEKPLHFDYRLSALSHFAIQRCFPTEIFLRLPLPPMSRLNQTLPKIGNLIWGQRVGKAIVESDQNKWKNATERTPKFA